MMANKYKAKSKEIDGHKGFKTPDYVMRRKLFKHKYSSIEFWEV